LNSLELEANIENGGLSGAALVLLGAGRSLGLDAWHVGIQIRVVLGFQGTESRLVNGTRCLISHQARQLGTSGFTLLHELVQSEDRGLRHDLRLRGALFSRLSLRISRLQDILGLIGVFLGIQGVLVDISETEGTAASLGHLTASASATSSLELSLRTSGLAIDRGTLGTVSAIAMTTTACLMLTALAAGTAATSILLGNSSLSSNLRLWGCSSDSWCSRSLLVTLVLLRG
jgi:hypothetical protein